MCKVMSGRGGRAVLMGRQQPNSDAPHDDVYQTDAYRPDAYRPTAYRKAPAHRISRSTARNAATAAAVIGLLDALFMVLSATGLLLVSGVGGGLGPNTLPASDPTLDNDRHALWFVAGLAGVTVLMMLSGAFLQLSQRPRGRRRGRLLMTWALTAAAFGWLLQSRIADLSVSYWWSVAVVGLAAIATVLAWIAARRRH